MLSNNYINNFNKTKIYTSSMIFTPPPNYIPKKGVSTGRVFTTHKQETWRRWWVVSLGLFSLKIQQH